MTLRRLISHTAGLTLHGYPGYDPDQELPTIEQSLSGESNAGEPVLYCEPGTNWKYSGGGFTIAQLMLEEVSGRDFGEYMRAEVFEPCGMLATDYRWTPPVTAAAATPYDRSARPIGGPRFIARAAAGCQTSVLDLARFAAASLAADAESAEAGELLSPKTLALMQARQESAPGYGLGYSVEDLDGVRVVGHGAANKGWMAQLSLAPELGDGIVILTNGTNGGRVLGPIRDAWLATLREQRGG